MKIPNRFARVLTAVLMVVGIFTIATNPLALFHRKEQ